MEKYIIDNQVAVLYSSGFGSGWYTWNREYPELMFDVPLVKYLLSDRTSATRTEVIAYLEEKYPGIYIGSNFDDLRVFWVDKGDEFRIQEFNGSEVVIVRAHYPDLSWHVA